MSKNYAMTDIIAALEPIAEWQPKEIREIAERMRWENGWQGVGPLSYRSLKYTVGGDSLRQTFLAIDAANPPNSLRDAYKCLGFPVGGGVTTLPEGPVSLRQMAKRILSPDTVKLKFISYNTYLLQGFQIPLGRWIDDAIGWDALSWFGIPFGGALLTLLGITSPMGVAIGEVLTLAGWTPSKIVRQIAGIDLNGIQIGAKPALEDRASELGPILSNYDVCCLCEVWTKDSQDRIFDELASRGWNGVTGPDGSGDWILNGSGLFFLLKNRRIAKTEQMIYSDRGNRNRDSDAWSNKGVMLNIIDLDFGQLEIFQTHLYYGGGIKDNISISFPGISDPSEEDRLHVWRSELAELANFYNRHHKPQNIAILTGDFNMSGADVRQYAEVRRVMDDLNLRDLWAWDVYGHNPSEGLSCRFTDGEKQNWVRNFDAQCIYLPNSQDQQYCNDNVLMRSPPRRGVGRFDFIFVECPSIAHSYRLEVSRILRRPFKRRHETEGESYLSDHLGLDVTIYCSPN